MPKPSAEQSDEPGPLRFDHGVASGDPTRSSVILWTRVSGGAQHEVELRWWISAVDPGGELQSAAPVRRGVVQTGPARDFTAKVDPGELEPGRRYAYGFEAGGVASPVGYTKTLPVGGVDRVRLAVASCANLPAGFFNAYAHMAKDSEIDAVLHLGDYLYELANGAYGDGTALGRLPDPLTEALTLEDYRARHASYKRDADLQAVHAAHPFIAIWDDHELANNAAWEGAQDHDSLTHGPWPSRRRAAVQAYLEWMPIREAAPDAGGRPEIYRAFAFGDLVDLFMLDTRLVGRDIAPDQAQYAAGKTDAHLLGEPQRQWLDQGLRSSTARWRCLGQQIMVSQLNDAEGAPAILDTWDGYPRARDQLLEALATAGPGSNVILTGDIHSSWAAEIRADLGPAGPLLASEFVTPAVSSPGLSGPWWPYEHAKFMARHPHFRWSQWTANGYLMVEFEASRALASWIHVDTVAQPSMAASVVQRAQLTHGGSALKLLGPPA